MEFGKFDRVLCRVGIHRRRVASTSDPEITRFRCWCGSRFWAQPKGMNAVEYRQPKAGLPTESEVVSRADNIMRMLGGRRGR